MTVAGTPDDPSIWAPATPANLGEGYNYCAFSWTYWWGAAEQPQHARFVSFTRVKNASRAKVLQCLWVQQVPSLGRIGPHRFGRAWNILWANGKCTLNDKGIYVDPTDFTLYCNYVGEWK
ncbi:MAG: hypothetical protein N3A66_03445 [Planctomycetota bacterium]|nr:hypothetical protein [Planctomycetota bacterium]